MTDILLRCLLLSIVTIAICCTFWDEMIFEGLGKRIKQFIGDKLRPKLPKTYRFEIGEYWAKPLFGCYVCATFWYGLLQCAIYGWPLWLCVPAMGVSAVISQLSKD